MTDIIEENRVYTFEMQGESMKTYQHNRNRQYNALAFLLCGMAAAVVTLIGASLWEGNAAVSPDILDRGYFVATNSFPINTIVDVTNLENGKKIRVMVVDGLDQPGLLLTLSRDAAETIGLSLKSLGRVRMEQPSEEEAYSQFINGSPSSVAATTAGTLPAKEAVPPPPVAAEPPPVEQTTPAVVAPSPPVEQTPPAVVAAPSPVEKTTPTVIAAPSPVEKTTPTVVAAPPPVEKTVAKPKDEPLDILNYPPPEPTVVLKKDANPQPVWIEASNQAGTKTPEVTPVTASGKENSTITITERPEPAPLPAAAKKDTPVVAEVPPSSKPSAAKPAALDTPVVAEVPPSPKPSAAKPTVLDTPTYNPAPLPPAATKDTPVVADIPPSPKSSAATPAAPDTSAYTLALLPTDERPPEASSPPELPPEAVIAPLPLPRMNPSDRDDAASVSIDEPLLIEPLEQTRVTQAAPPRLPDTDAFIAPVARVSPSADAPTPSVFIAPVARVSPSADAPTPSVFIAPVAGASTPSAASAPTTASRAAVPDPNAFIAPIAGVPTPSAAPTSRATVHDPNAFIAPIGEAPQRAPAPSISAVPAPTAASRSTVPDPNAFIAPVGEAPQRAPTPRVSNASASRTPTQDSFIKPASNADFSIPTIANLERGKDYVQLLAYNRAEQVEAIAAEIGTVYPLAVQSVGTGSDLLFKLLVGPVNLGESGALLQQFRGIGYKDAFIRLGS
jgi:hypothetical protein